MEVLKGGVCVAELVEKGARHPGGHHTEQVVQIGKVTKPQSRRVQSRGGFWQLVRGEEGRSAGRPRVCDGCSHSVKRNSSVSNASGTNTRHAEIHLWESSADLLCDYPF